MPTCLRSKPAVLALFASLALTGCGVGLQDTATSPILMPGFSGKAFGGTNPVIGATVKIYATGTTPGDGTSTNTGYGVGTLLQEATKQGASAGQDTDANGSFTFAGGYNCPAGQFVYLVASGGNSGAGVNANSVLVGALGRCEDLYNNVAGKYTGYKGSSLYVDELTTVAAAYALGQFSAESGTGAATQVLIGATATNNAAQVAGVSTGCVAGVGTCTTTAAAGLAHAFQNALNLVSPFTTGGAQPAAYTTLPGNASAQVPQALLDSIANVIVSCVNSTGGAAGDSSICGKVFSATTIGTKIPVDTFGALVNLAANPTLNGSVTAVDNFLALATAQSSVYSPYLTATTNLNDLSIAILYPQTMGAATTANSTCATAPCQGLIYPSSGAIDINDNYYAGNQASTGGSANVNIFALSSTGTLLGTTTTATGLKGCFGLSVDGNVPGNGYCANQGGSGSSELGHFTFSSAGVPSATLSILTLSANGLTIKPNVTAVDAANNVWVAGLNNGGASSVYKSAAGGGTFTAVATTAPPTVASGVTGLAIDPNQNVWVDTTGTTLYVIPNTGSISTPTYAGSAISGTATITPTVGITFAGTSATSYTAYVSAYSTTSQQGIEPFTFTLTGSTVSNLTPGTASTAGGNITGTFYNQADGAGNIWVADVNSHSVESFNPTAGTAYRIKPCVQITSGTCGAAWGTVKPYYVSIDSTGSVWVPAPNVGAGFIVEIIGAAAPTWPLLSLGKLGTP